MPKIRLHLNEALGHEASDKRLDILRQTGECGSISEAARACGVSYKAAWQAIDTLSNLAGIPLLARSVGGSGGGGATLTDAGLQLLHAAQLMNEARAQVLAGLQRGNPNPTPAVAGLGLRTSMRNHLPCRISRIERKLQAVHVHLQLPDGTPLVSRITRESVELLGLKPGQDVLALCKATAVSVVPAAPASMGTTNVLPGVVQRLSRAAAGGEASLALASGLQLVGFAAACAGLKRGQAALACVEPSAVVIALMG
jgi:molybdate transport system regulatory protein